MAAPFNEVHSVKKFRLLTRKKDSAGNEYVYLKGVGSTVAGDFVQVLPAGTTARMTTTTFGPIAVAQAAIVADKYGWYMIWGKSTGAHVAAAVAGNPLFASGTTGEATNSAANDTAIYGAFAAGTAATNAADVFLSYPTANGNITV